MNGATDLPGIERLFREHKRLATKLTSEELKALNDYIESRLLQDQAELYFQFYALQNDYDLTLRRSSEAISDLHQELGEKKEILKQYRDSDETISTVHKRKEARWEKKQELLLSEIEKGDEAYNQVKKQLIKAEKELEEKNKIMKELEEKMDTAEEAIQQVDEAKMVVKEREKVRQEMLRLKLEIDKRDRALAAVDKEVTSLRNEKKRLVEEKKFTEIKVTGLQKELQKQMQDVAHKCTHITELEFLVQDEKRQVAELQRLMKKMKEEKASYTRILADSERAEFSNRERNEMIIKKDLDVTDAKIKLLEVTCRVRDDEAQSVVERIEQSRVQEKLANQIKNEVFIQGNTFLELTIVELLKKVDAQKTKLAFELRRVRDISDIKKEASLLKTDINALKKQAEINMLIDLANKASKQIHRVDAGVKALKEKSKHHVPLLTDRREKKKKPVDTAEVKGQTFITSQSPDGGAYSKMPTTTPRKNMINGLTKLRPVEASDKSMTQSVDIQSLTPSHVHIGMKSPPNTFRGKHQLAPIKTNVAKAVSYPNIPYAVE